jgi:ElaA protein
MSGKPKLEMHWKTVPFDALTGIEVHDMLKVREEIFVVEQNCAYHEIDGKDPECIHVLGRNGDGPVIATARIAPAGLIYKEVSIGRVVVQADFRKYGLGHVLMNHAIEYCRDTLHAKTVKIAAQEYLEKFYSEHGFVTISASYLWDGIPHVDMRLSFGSTE